MVGFSCKLNVVGKSFLKFYIFFSKLFEKSDKKKNKNMEIYGKSVID